MNEFVLNMDALKQTEAQYRSFAGSKMADFPHGKEAGRDMIKQVVCSTLGVPTSLYATRACFTFGAKMQGELFSPTLVSYAKIYNSSSTFILEGMFYYLISL